MKRRLLILGLVVALLAILSAGSLAYYVSYGTSENVIATGNVNAVLHNECADGTPANTEMVCMPGDRAERVVTVENAGSQPFYLRIELLKYVQNSDLSALTIFNLDINEEEWTYKDGYYYYNEELQPGQSTKPLFTHVEIDGSSVNNAYMGKTMVLDVLVYAVQSRNNGQTVWEATGWPTN